MEEKNLLQKVMSRSQFGQDVFVLHQIYGGKREGYFVEVGASEGVWDSNTYHLEKDYDWKGICVECCPARHPALFAARSCHLSTAAVYDQNDVELEFYDSSIGGHSGLVETITNPDVKNYSNVIRVKTKTLLSILDEFGAPPFIDFLSLDTEGSEFRILQAFDFNRYKFGYMCIEHNHVEPNRSQIRALLESKGYVFYRENHVDDDYILKELLPLSL